MSQPQFWGVSEYHPTKPAIRFMYGYTRGKANRPRIEEDLVVALDVIAQARDSGQLKESLMQTLPGIAPMIIDHANHLILPITCGFDGVDYLETSGGEPL